MEYRYINNHYVLCSGDDQIGTPTKTIAILYSDTKSGTVLHAHGAPEQVQLRFDEMRGRFMAHGLNDMAAEVKMLTSSDISVSELNKCVQICDYLGRMIQRNEREAHQELPELSF